LFKKLWQKLSAKPYREAFVAAHLKRSVPFQIKALRDRRGWSQADLAERAGLTQGVVSRAEDPDYGNLTFNTVIRIAAGFDVAFIGRFVPFSELARSVAVQNEDSVQVASFDQDSPEAGERATEVIHHFVGAATTKQQFLSYRSYTHTEKCAEGESSLATVPVELLIQAQTTAQAYSIN